MAAKPSLAQASARATVKKVGSSVTALPGRAEKDAKLMARACNQDRAAFELLVRHYGPRLKAWLINRGENPVSAEDIVQEVLVTAWRKADMFDPAKASFSTWIFRVTRNKWIDVRRRGGRMVAVEPSIISEMADAPVDEANTALERGEAAAELHRELALLPTEQRRMLYLAFFEGLSHAQIAERTGIALGTVKSRIRAPLKALRGKLAQFDGEMYE
ncbi:MAG: sigma-70 family RNA polymerase sigma factor [Pseudomonadota bacterium]